MKREQILEAISASALRHLREPLAEVLMPSVRITTTDIDDDELAEPGRSRFGGIPDLPVCAPWPTVDSIPLEFVGQIDLADLAPHEAAAILPRRGLLSFFFDGMLSGYENGETPDRSCVIYTDTTTTKVAPLAPPESVPEAFGEYTAALPAFEDHWTMPELEEIDGDEFPTIPANTPILRTSSERRIYHALRKRLRGKYIGSKVLGCRRGSGRRNSIRGRPQSGQGKPIPLRGPRVHEQRCARRRDEGSASLAAGGERRR